MTQFEQVLGLFETQDKPLQIQITKQTSFPHITNPTAFKFYTFNLASVVDRGFTWTYHRLIAQNFKSAILK